MNLIDVEQNKLDINFLIFNNLSFNRITKFAIDQSFNWVLISKYNFINIEQKIDCEALDSKLFETCNEFVKNCKLDVYDYIDIILNANIKLVEKLEIDISISARTRKQFDN